MQSRLQPIFGLTWDSHLILPGTPDIVSTPLGHLVPIADAHKYLLFISEPVDAQLQFRPLFNPTAKAHPIFTP
ncbi:hypothetical protein EQG49_00430 [Periweissella cryptocerci]|uniref:Uncharacterized protein n=1 Tax=Periweissella cryptocerci TaxID=2506420 RepID=A0A4P6YQX9_9LACO|nr:hypothetical protein [Periweissella cryptocerci]QBO35020.1 hypothetical protein EQG49_00430 [Periweissella cryptocerci]